jgi:hypothetical protein
VVIAAAFVLVKCVPVLGCVPSMGG